MKKIILFFLAWCAVSAHAVETIAVHPIFFDKDYTETELGNIFFEELIKAIPNVPGYEGLYNTYVIDLQYNRPEDVPEEGFPAYFCPHPGITGGAQYSLTAELNPDENMPGSFRLQMYLWRNKGGRLLVSDVLYAYDRDSVAASYPFALAFFFSIIGRPNWQEFPWSLAANLEFGMNTRESFGMGYGINLDRYVGTQYFSLGIRGSMYDDSVSITASEALLTVRFHIPGPWRTEFFFQWGMGVIAFREEEWQVSSYVMDISAGWRIYLREGLLKGFFVEPYVRTGFPGVLSGGLMIGHWFDF